MKNLRSLLFVFLFLISFSSAVFAEEIKIAFTGQSYAMLYPCSCPMAPNGGVARRATLIKKLRQDSKNVVVVEAGSSMASGAQDQYSQNYEADSRRTDIYLQSLKAMGYDALLLSGQECVFGQEFLKRYKDMPFVSSNIEGLGLPYVIKNVGGLKIGILGLTDISALSRGVSGWQAPISVLGQRVSQLKKQGVSIIVLLSSLAPQQDEELLRNIDGVDIVINGSQFFGSVVVTEKKGVAYLSTGWQSKAIGVLTLEVSGKNITKKSLESLELSKDVSDDEKVASLLPQCFSNGDCKKMPGFVSRCENASTPQARCVYVGQTKVNISVLRPRECRTCRPEDTLQKLRNIFGELNVNYLSEDEASAQEVIKEFKITMLPAYFFDKVDIEKLENFSSFAANLDSGRRHYLIKPSQAGVSYLIGRKRVPKRLDIFFSCRNEQLSGLSTLLKAFSERHKDFDLHFHFIAVRDEKGEFISKGGEPEIEEFGRLACIDAIAPQKTLGYLLCRSQQKGPDLWDVCVPGTGLDAERIKKCVLSEEGRAALSDRIRMTEELEVASGPTFIVENKEIFSIVNVPTLEEFEKIVVGEEKTK